MSFDNVCKTLAEKYPKDFARWLLKVEASKIEVLKTELSIEPIRADSVTFLPEMLNVKKSLIKIAHSAKYRSLHRDFGWFLGKISQLTQGFWLV